MNVFSGRPGLLGSCKSHAARTDGNHHRSPPYICSCTARSQPHFTHCYKNRVLPPRSRGAGGGEERVCLQGMRKDAGEEGLRRYWLIGTVGCTATCTGKGWVRYTGLGGRERIGLRAVQLHKWGREAGLGMEELSPATTRCQSNREMTSDTNCDNRPRTGDLRRLPCGRMPWPVGRFSGQAPPRAPSSTAWRSCLPVSSSPP